MVQGQRLAADPGNSLHQKLHGWAAAGQSGSLHVTREFRCCPSDMHLSPSLHSVSARCPEGNSATYKAAALAEAGPSVDVQQLLAAEGLTVSPTVSPHAQQSAAYRCADTLGVIPATQVVLQFSPEMSTWIFFFKFLRKPQPLR